jgi:hypothetical protein
MSPIVHQALRTLQEISYAHMLHELRVARTAGQTAALFTPGAAHARIVRCKRDLSQCKTS